MKNRRFGISDFRLVACRRFGMYAPSENPKSQIPNLKSPRLGISLLEILISMFVMLFGLMGVAALFPVGSFYVQQGEKFDRGNSLAQNAFEELLARGLLRPEVWLYADSANLVINNTTNLFFEPFGAGNRGPGLAFVIDPLGSVNASATNGDLFPFTSLSNAWESNIRVLNPAPSPLNQPGTRWPVRRLTMPQTPGVVMSGAVAETIFRLRDDLAVELPKEDDHPAIQRWSVDNTNRLLARQYQGNYSWLATIVPTSEKGLLGLQPADSGSGAYRYDVSVVVFYKRDIVPSADSERLIDAEMLAGGELVLYAATAAFVDAAVEDIRPGSWIAVMGVHQTTGAFLMKWYRLLSLDDETLSDRVETVDGNRPLRRAMLAGPDWPSLSGAIAVTDLRVALLPGAISAVTRQLKMGGNPEWDTE